MTGKTRLDKEKLAQSQHELESIGGQARAWRLRIYRCLSLLSSHFTLQVRDNSSHCPGEIPRGPGLPGPSPQTERRSATRAAGHLHLDDLGGEEGGLPSDEGAQPSLQVGVPEIGVER